MVAAFGDGRCLLLVAAASGARNAKRDDDPPAKTKPRPPHPWITPRDSPAALNSILVPCPELLGISCANARESRNGDSTNRRPSATKFSPFARFGEKYGARPSANSDTLAQRTVCAAHAFFGKAARRHGFDVRHSTKRTRRETETNDITSAARRGSTRARSMSPVIAARDARRARDAVPITIGPRYLVSAAIEIHDATRAYEPGFVTVEHTEDARARDAIDVADDALTLPAHDL